MASNILGILFPALLFSISDRIRYPLDIFPDIQQVYFSIRIYSCSMSKKE